MVEDGGPLDREFYADPSHDAEALVGQDCGHLHSADEEDIFGHGFGLDEGTDTAQPSGGNHAVANSGGVQADRHGLADSHDQQGNMPGSSTDHVFTCMGAGAGHSSDGVTGADSVGGLQPCSSSRGLRRKADTGDRRDEAAQEERGDARDSKRMRKGVQSTSSSDVGCIRDGCLPLGHQGPAPHRGLSPAPVPPSACQPVTATARAPIGDRDSSGRAARVRLSRPSRSPQARDACRATPLVERELKRRRIRGKQPPPDGLVDARASASGPVHSSAVDQREADAHVLWPSA